LDRAVGVYEARWSQRLIELAGGSTPSPARATELFLSHALDAQRLERLLERMLANAAARGESAKLLARVATTPAVIVALKAAVAGLSSDPATEAQIVDGFSALFANEPDFHAADAALRAIVLAPANLARLKHVFQVVGEDPAVARAAATTAAALWAD